MGSRYVPDNSEALKQVSALGTEGRKKNRPGRTSSWELKLFIE